MHQQKEIVTWNCDKILPALLHPILKKNYSKLHFFNSPGQGPCNVKYGLANKVDFSRVWSYHGEGLSSTMLPRLVPRMLSIRWTDPTPKYTLAVGITEYFSNPPFNVIANRTRNIPQCTTTLSLICMWMERDVTWIIGTKILSSARKRRKY